MSATNGFNASGPAVWLRQMVVMTGKELRQLLRDRVLLIYVIYLFTINIIMAGNMGSGDLSNARLVVHDADHSAASRDLIYRFQQPYFRLLEEAPDARTAMRRVERGEAMLLLDIPEHFQRTLEQGGQPASVQLLVDTSNATRGYLASSYAGGIGTNFMRDWLNAGSGATSTLTLPSISTQARVWYNPALNGAWFHTVSELLTMLTVACILLPAAALVREKERGTIEQLLVTPLRPFQIMFSKVLAMALAMLAGACLSIYGIMIPVFGVPFRGSPPLFFLLTALYAFTTSGLGLLIATFARNQAQAGMLVLVIVMPIIMLSGTWTPRESLPPLLNTMMLLSPMRHFIEIAYGILLRGADLRTIADSVGAMLLLGALLFAFGMSRFRTQLR
jgi:ABC-2 type transport system permease protein